jgi:predicted nuclease of predicted toxin-antitoxin system
VDLLADENQHPVVVARLRAAGYNVEFIRESSPGAQDKDILARPDIGSVLLLTYDRDFGDLIFNHGLPAPAAILYTRLNRVEPDVIASRLLSLLEAGVTPGHITTITKDGERLKPFPAGASNG